MARKTAYKKPTRKYKYRKPRRPKGAAKDTDAKARSIQTSWRKYTGTSLPLPDAKSIIANPPQCIYCLKDILWPQLSLDHLIPQSRSGPANAENLAFVHNSCNRIKGNLTKDEFMALLKFLEDWPLMKISVLDRLRIAGALYGRRKRG